MRSCSPRPIPRSRTAPRCPGRSVGRPGRAGRGRPRRPPRRRGRALRRARRTLASSRSATPTRSGCGRPRRPRPAREDEARAAPRGRALRRRASCRHRADASAARGRVPRRPPTRRPPPLEPLRRARLITKPWPLRMTTQRMPIAEKCSGRPESHRPPVAKRDRVADALHQTVLGRARRAVGLEGHAPGRAASSAERTRADRGLETWRSQTMFLGRRVKPASASGLGR